MHRAFEGRLDKILSLIKSIFYEPNQEYVADAIGRWTEEASQMGTGLVIVEVMAIGSGRH